MLKLRFFVDHVTDGTFHRGILTHENLPTPTHALTNILKLLRCNVVGVTNEDFLILVQQATDLAEVVGFPFGSYSSPNHISKK